MLTLQDLLDHFDKIRSAPGWEAKDVQIRIDGPVYFAHWDHGEEKPYPMPLEIVARQGREILLRTVNPYKVETKKETA